MGWFGGNCYWMFLFWVKELGRGNLWEKTGQRVCVHIPHVWPLTVPSVCSAVWWSNKSPDRPKIEELGEPFSYKASSLFIYLSRERNWTHMFFLSTPCYSFTPGSCPVQPQTFTDVHFTAACSFEGAFRRQRVWWYVLSSCIMENVGSVFLFFLTEPEVQDLSTCGASVRTFFCLLWVPQVQHKMAVWPLKKITWRTN